jgi:hypothetical protein
MLVMKCSRCGGEIWANTNMLATQIVAGSMVEKDGVPVFYDSHKRNNDEVYCGVCSVLIERFAKNYTKEG